MTTWNEAKRQENLRKHRIELALAARFEFRTALIREDRDVAHEQRFQAIGFIGSKLHFLVYTYGPNDEPHAISLRVAEPKERRLYVKSL
ncbi:MAG: BrnT family toxin [Rhizobiales bacterium]|nr:BrnT family toxin [Hyphomicrobiales bacterium]